MDWRELAGNAGSVKVQPHLDPPAIDPDTILKVADRCPAGNPQDDLRIVLPGYSHFACARSLQHDLAAEPRLAGLDRYIVIFDMAPGLTSVTCASMLPL